jgi:hypothetical protein
MPDPNNEAYVLEITAPLLRPGMTLKVGPFSKKYAAQVMESVMRVVREFNDAQSPIPEVKDRV